MKVIVLLFIFVVSQVGLAAQTCYEIKAQIVKSTSGQMTIRTNQDEFQVDFTEKFPAGGPLEGVTVAIKAWGDDHKLVTNPKSLDVTRRFLASSERGIKVLKGFSKEKCLAN